MDLVRRCKLCHLRPAPAISPVVFVPQRTLFLVRLVLAHIDQPILVFDPLPSQPPVPPYFVFFATKNKFIHHQSQHPTMLGLSYDAYHLHLLTTKDRFIHCQP